MSLVVFLLLLHICVGVSWAQPPVVETQYGAIQGFVDIDSKNRTYDAFLGIPFAAPPVDDLRWERPVTPEPWDDVINATQWQAHCIQPIAVLYPLMDMSTNESEDCLYLNIWVPGSVQDALAAPKPVMLFYYGGGFDIGTAEMYPGDELATAADVIVVNTNYRVSVTGFFSTGDSVAPGNYGLWDAKASLQWVIDNIANFGGDATRLTIFGQSAGAGVVTHLMLSNQTNQMFQRAIAISGSAKYEEQGRTVERAADMNDWLECNATDNTELVDCLRLVDAKELDEESRRRAALDDIEISYQPRIDGIFVHQDTRVSWEQGAAAHIDLMTGSTYHDSAGFVLTKVLGTPFPNETNDYNKNNQDLYDGWYRDYDWYDNVDEIIQALYNQFPDMNSTDDAVASEACVRVETDVEFGAPSFHQGEFHSRSGGVGRTYMYVFKYRQSFLDGYPQWTNGSHLDDMYSVLGESFMTVYHEALLDDWSEEDRQMSDIVMKYYGNFAYTGDPSQGPHAVDLTWPEYDAVTRSYLVETATPMVTTVSQELIDHYNWLLYDFMGLINPVWAAPV